MLDFAYKLARKCMTGSTYETIRGSFFGRKQRLETLDTYRNIFYKYQEITEKDFNGKIVLEVGCGNQIFTALFLLAAGCEKVILLDPALKIFNDDEHFKRSLALFKAETSNFSLSEDEVRKSLLHINDLQEITDTLNGKIHFIFTHFVLEHFEDLDIFFSAVNKLLSPDGISFNKVDLSDHTYHIFDRFRFSSFLNKTNNLNHLRYSAKQFAFINDKKCFMNRFLLPIYLQKAVAHNLVCKIIKKDIFYKNVPIHKDIVKELDVFLEDDLKTTIFEMLLFKNGGNFD